MALYLNIFISGGFLFDISLKLIKVFFQITLICLIFIFLLVSLTGKTVGKKSIKYLIKVGLDK